MPDDHGRKPEDYSDSEVRQLIIDAFRTHGVGKPRPKLPNPTLNQLLRTALGKHHHQRRGYAKLPAMVAALCPEIEAVREGELIAYVLRPGESLPPLSAPAGPPLAGSADSLAPVGARRPSPLAPSLGEAKEIILRALRMCPRHAHHRHGVDGATLGQMLLQHYNGSLHGALGFKRLSDLVLTVLPGATVERHLDLGGNLLFVIPEGSFGEIRPVQERPAPPRPSPVVAVPRRAPRTPLDLTRELDEWLRGRYPKTDSSGEPAPALAGVIADHVGGKPAAAVAALSPHVGPILDGAAGGVTSAERQILVRCCWADADLAVESRQWELAAHMVLAALELGAGTDVPQPPAWRASQFALAAFHLGAQALELDPARVQQAMTPQMLQTLAVVMARAVRFDTGLAKSIAGDHDNLYFDVVEHVIQEVLPRLTGAQIAKRSKKELRWGASELLAEASRDFAKQTTEIRNAILRPGSDGVRKPAALLLKHLGRYEILLLESERLAWEQLKPLLGRPLGELIHSPGEVVPAAPANLEALSRYAASLAEVQARATRGTWVESEVLGRVAGHLAALVRDSRADATAQHKPSLALRPSRRRYPLGQTERDISLMFEVQNLGVGPAEHAQLRVDAVPDGVALLSDVVALGTVPRGESVSRALTISILTPLRALRLDVSLVCRDSLGEEFRDTDQIVVDAQGDDPDWEKMLEAVTYTLEPVEHADNLRGRGAQLDKLRTNVATLTSTIVWGQKRVGKTSVARVLWNELRNKNGYVVLYTNKGDIAGYDEGRFAHDVAERLLRQCKARNLLRDPVPLPSIGDFGAHITRLTRFVDDLRDAGLTQTAVTILDEFDDFSPHFFHGERGQNFFHTLRSLSERRVVFVLVGSERMPALFRRYQQLLNKFDTLQIDFITDPVDLVSMIKQPVAGYLEYDPDAVSDIASLSSGNPYYVNLICKRILHAMVTARRTYVDSTDVRKVRAELAIDSAPTHWGHLWEDSDLEDPAGRMRREIESAMVLTGLGRRPAERALHLEQIVEKLEQEWDRKVPADLDVKATIDALVARHVLVAEDTETGRRYNGAVRLFRHWLCENARTGLFVPYKPRLVAPPVARPDVAQPVAPVVVINEFPLPDEALISVADGLVYGGRHVEAMQCKTWLRQFRDDARIILAFKLLSALKKRWYFDETRVSVLIDRAFDHAVRIARDAGVMAKFVSTSKIAPEYHLKADYLRRDESRGVIANFFVSYFGESTKSGAEIARAVKKVKRLASAGEINRALSWIEEESDVQSAQRMVFIVDDFVGSGYQVGRWAREQLMVKAKGRRLVEAALRENRIAFIPLVAYQRGLDSIVSEIPALRQEPAHLLDDNDRAFAPDAGVFDSDDERRMAESICRHIGGQLYRDHPLGWAEMQSLVVFSRSVPNSTLPIFWSAGIVDEHPWKPLFPA